MLGSGDVIGKYQVIRPLGKGGEGTVYLVKHLQTEQIWLMKVWPLQDAAGRRRELSMLKKLRHTGLPLVIDYVQTDRFDGIAAASPSIWFPHFTEYMRENQIRADAVYLSLGDREERAKNPVMALVGNAIREAESILRDAGTDCILEWNKGNHVKEPDLRTAKAFAWLMNREKAKYTSSKEA